jgi:hypothetical protein
LAEGAASAWGESLVPLPATSWQTDSAARTASVVGAATWPSHPQDDRAPNYALAPASLRGRMLSFVHKGDIMRVWTGPNGGRRPVPTDSPHSG